MTVRTPSPVTHTPPASAEEARVHFARRLALETDCSDVHAALARGAADFVVIDVRSERRYAEGHVPGARHVPHASLSEECLADIPRDTLLVVYCAGAHCNGATKGALRIAGLGRPVKEMIGGMVGWRLEGYAVEGSPPAGREGASRTTRT